jgi:hypothetical protein
MRAKSVPLKGIFFGVACLVLLGFVAYQMLSAMQASAGPGHAGDASASPSKAVSTETVWSDLEHLLRVRPSGSEGISAVREYIIQQLREAGWQIAEDAFDDKTPMGPVRFSNIIASRNEQSAKKRVVLSAHYDSKYFPVRDSSH